MADLAKRHDPRVLPMVVNSVKTKDDCPRAVEAARFLLDLTGEQEPFGSPRAIRALANSFTA
jgi:hypothetical protein